MSEHNEQYRLRCFRSGELPTGLYSTLTFECDDPDDCLTKVISVMELIAEHDREHWPEDSYWAEILPDWLLRTFKSYTPRELSDILSDRSGWANLPWTFGSWLDRMRDRDWRWWSLMNAKGAITIHLAIEGHPFSAKALEHLIAAAGGSRHEEIVSP